MYQWPGKNDVCLLLQRRSTVKKKKKKKIRRNEVPKKTVGISTFLPVYKAPHCRRLQI